MNRKDRRRSEKLARDARPEDILPGSFAPVRGLETLGKRDVMTELLNSLQKIMPGWQFTLFMFEPPEAAAAENRLPAMNYGSTVDRADMLAVMKAFIMKNEDPAEYERLAKLDDFHLRQSTKGTA
ncbi:hypothetical protein DYI24_00330 [Rhodopseudomonas sp. BR0C11]|uniref:hypothetical protein n=1 Tax=Rhodopseudomonas sp. BR0C11 TaxID=2269370 RepID=UPI0013E06649|nr:hypothetical protein [Rhodopseudomonas sp. BR0C11]NEV75528.1 hypothetical protein [Rhodopseudomonas sp. BR0C11]